MTWFWGAVVLTAAFTALSLIIADDYYSKAGLATATFFGTGIITGLIALVLNAICMNANYISKQHESFVTDIVNLHDGSETQGHGSLFYFVVETYPRFTYYVQNSDTSYSPEYVDDTSAQHVRIFEDGTGNPRLDCMTDYLVKGHNNSLSIWGPSIDTNSCHDYVFHVPPGSVSRQFAVGGGSG